MGYVTQKRSFPIPGLQDANLYRNGVRQPGGMTAAQIAATTPYPTQETTSFRSGRSEMGPDPVEDEMLDATDSIALRRAVKKEAKRTRRLPSPYDNGHTFSSTRQYWTGDIPYVDRPVTSTLVGSYRYAGPLFPDPAGQLSGYGGAYPSLVPESDSTSWYETRAINATIPTHPVASLAVSLGELMREGLPALIGSSLLKEKTRIARDMPANEYLNYEFGWKPLVNDLNKVMTAVAQAKYLIEQRARDSGRIVRRGYSFPLESTTVTSRGGSALQDVAQFGTNGIARGARRHLHTITTTRKVWFAGGYSYYLPEPSEQRKLRELYAFEEKVSFLLGTRLTPEVVWNLAPWSWLTDWNSNMGTIISNATALSQDGLVIRYGYLMVHDKRTYSRHMEDPYLGDHYLPSFTATRTTERKLRKQASPFGFGLNPNSFTGRQWAILAALGMTKSERTLRQSQ